MFLSFTILFIKFLYNLNWDFLVVVVVVVVVFFVLFCFVFFGLGTGSGANTSLGILPRFFVEDIFLLNLLRIFSLALINNPSFFKKDLYFQLIVYLYPHPLIY